MMTPPILGKQTPENSIFSHLLAPPLLKAILWWSSDNFKLEQRTGEHQGRSTGNDSKRDKWKIQYMNFCCHYFAIVIWHTKSAFCKHREVWSNQWLQGLERINSETDCCFFHCFSCETWGFGGPKNESDCADRLEFFHATSGQKSEGLPLGFNMIPVHSVKSDNQEITMSVGSVRKVWRSDKCKWKEFVKCNSVQNFECSFNIQRHGLYINQSEKKTSIYASYI